MNADRVFVASGAMQWSQVARELDGARSAAKELLAVRPGTALDEGGRATMQQLAEHLQGADAPMHDLLHGIEVLQPFFERADTDAITAGSGIAADQISGHLVYRAREVSRLAGAASMAAELGTMPKTRGWAGAVLREVDASRRIAELGEGVYRAADKISGDETVISVIRPWATDPLTGGKHASL